MKLSGIIPRLNLLDIENDPSIHGFEPDKKTGVYFLIKGSQVIYVGQSVDIDSRVRTHRADKDFDRVLWRPCAEFELTDIENWYIIALSPSLNKTHGSAKTLNDYRIMVRDQYKSGRI